MFPSIKANGNAYFTSCMSIPRLPPYKHISKIRPVPNNIFAVSNNISELSILIKKDTIYNKTLK
jgi:hypothetical protein